MTKTLIKVTNTYSTKNKLQKQIFENLQALDLTLCKELSDAIKLINLAFKDAINNYQGVARKPELKSFLDDKKTTVFYIEDVIYLSMYTVKYDFTK